MGMCVLGAVDGIDGIFHPTEGVARLGEILGEGVAGFAPLRALIARLSKAYRMPCTGGSVDDLQTLVRMVGVAKDAAPGTVEGWGRSDGNPVGGWYGLRKGYRGRFGMYLPPLLEALGIAELTHDARNNRIRAL